MKNRFSRNKYNESDVGVIDVVREIPSSFSKVVGQPALRAFGGIASLLTGKSFTPTGQFQKDLYGTDKPITIQSTGQEFRGGIGGDRPLKIDPALGLFAGLADAVPGGGAAKKEVKAVIDGAEQLATPISKLISAIKSAGKPQATLEAAQSLERSKRAGNVARIFESGSGQKGYQQALGALKGELTERPKFSPIELDQTDLDSLFNQIQLSKNLDIYEKINASTGLNKLFSGELPQPNQLALLEDTFGRDFAQAVLEKRPALDKFKNLVIDTLNIPRALITSIDMSAPLRQGVLLTTTKPKAATAAFVEMFKQAFSQKNFEKWLADIPNNPYYRQMKNSGLYISDPTKISTGLSGREESFMTNIAEKIPLFGRLVKASGRAYVGYLNKLRVDVFTQLAKSFESDGISTPENLKSLANFVNSATGRGDLGKLNRSAQVLNNVFFSPRLIAARLNMLNPVWYARQTPPVRKEAIKTFAKFIATGSSILALAKAGGADVELDPRSTDFGKIKVGNTRWDIWGGFQQWVRVFSQLASGQRKTAKGDVIDINPKKFPFESRKDVAERFLAGKLAPVPSLAYELLQGQKLFGEKLSLSNEVLENTIPLYLQDMDEAINQIGPEAIFTVGVPSFFGVGTQTYQEKSSVNRFNR